jgi:hypothetical protein
MIDSAETQRLSMQETLRTIGNELEARQAQQVQIVIEAGGVAVASRGEHDAYWHYTWADVAAQLRVQIARRTAQPQPLPWRDPWALTRWSVLLRVTGQLLDTRGIDVCTVEGALGATPEAVVLRVLIRGEEVFRRTEVSVQLWRLRSQPRSGVPAAAPPERPWWRR